MTERDFLQVIENDPDDFDNYRVYADWLEDQGEQDRARLIRVSVEYEAAGRGAPRRDELWQQVADSRKKVEKSWSSVKKWSKHFRLRWHLGLPTGIECQEYPSVRSLRALPELPSLRRLDSGAVPTPEVFAALQERSGVRRLNLQGRSPDFEALARLVDVEGLSFDDNPVSEADLARLLPLTKLRSLNLWESPISDAGASLLTAFSLLEELNLSRTNITDAALERLAALKRLKGLLVEETPITDAGLKHLAVRKGLTALDVGETKVTEASLDVLLGFEKLRKLGLQCLAWVDDGKLQRLSALRHLRELDLRRTSVTRYNLRRSLKRFAKLKRVRMEGSLDECSSIEVSAFQEDMRESDYLVEMDFE